MYYSTERVKITPLKMNVNQWVLMNVNLNVNTRYLFKANGFDPISPRASPLYNKLPSLGALTRCQGKWGSTVKAVYQTFGA